MPAPALAYNIVRAGVLRKMTAIVNDAKYNDVRRT
jgi:hypothetical protein